MRVCGGVAWPHSFGSLRLERSGTGRRWQGRGRRMLSSVTTWWRRAELPQRRLLLQPNFWAECTVNQHERAGRYRIEEATCADV